MWTGLDSPCRLAMLERGYRGLIDLDAHARLVAQYEPAVGNLLVDRHAERSVDVLDLGA